MKLPTFRSTMLWTAAGAGLMGAGYVILATLAWSRYGRIKPARPDDADDLLDRFMPDYEVVERHHIGVAAPPALTLQAAKSGNLDESLLVRSIFRARELLLGAEPAAATSRVGLLAQMTAIGWRVLAEVPDREVVVGAVTQPWMPNVVFRGIPPEEFRAFREPGYVKIVWNLRADQAPTFVGSGLSRNPRLKVSNTQSVFRTETRVMTTDDEARSKFRWYWARFSPGITLIRRAMLPAVKRDAEALAQAAVS
jgi:hypothetical protein